MLTLRRRYERDIRASFVDFDEWDEPTIYTTAEPPSWRDFWKILTGRYTNRVVRLRRHIDDDSAAFLSPRRIGTGTSLSLPHKKEGEHPALTALKEAEAEKPTTVRSRKFDEVELNVTINRLSDR